MENNLIYLIIFLLLLIIIIYFFVSIPKSNLPENISINNINNNQKTFNLTAVKFPYQFEGGVSHVYIVNANISSFTFQIPSFNGMKETVLGPISYYKGNLLVPLSSMPNSILNFSQYSGGLLSINGSNGKMLWEKLFNNQIMTQPIVYKGIAYIGLGSAFYDPNKDSNGIVAVNATDGNIVWSRYIDSEHMPTFIVYNGTLVVTPGLGNPIYNSSGNLYFLNATNGNTIKKINTSSVSAMSSILVVNDTAYFGAARFNFSGNSPFFQDNFKNVFYSINLENKSINWVDKFNSSFGMQDCSPVFSNGVVITGYTSALTAPTITILGINYSNGKLLWKFTTLQKGNYSSEYIQLPPVTVYNSIVYSDSVTLGTLYAINASTGDEIWSVYTGPTSGNVNVIDNSLVILNSQGYLLQISFNGSLISKKYIGIPSGPESVIQIGKKLVIYGNSNKIEVLPISFLNFS